MKHFLEKNKIRILVTDSGIGGLSVVNDLYNFFQTNKYYQSVDIFFADSRFDNINYNELDNLKDKIYLFDKQLNFLNKELKPDILFIACNTLSVIIKYSDFYKKYSFPIIDITDISMNLLIHELMKDRHVFILGTKTTISENYYKNCLINYGFDKKLIVNQLCPNLARYIEESYQDKYNLKHNVDWLVHRIISKKSQNCSKYTVSFNCTHYYYSVKLFKKIFNTCNETPDFICPNIFMKNSFTDLLSIDRYSFCNTNVSIFKKHFTDNNIKKINYFLPIQKSFIIF